MLIQLFFYRFKRHMADILSLDMMSRKYHSLAVNYIFLMIYATLESVFVNTLLYRITPDISIVILYRGIIYAVCAVTMHLAAYTGQKKNPVTVIQIGGVLYLLMYVVLFFGMDHMKTLMFATAVLSGMGSAFYWSGHNTLIPHYTRPTNRDIGISILCIIQGVMTLLVPIISGSVISFCESVFGSHDLGYRIMFGLGMAVVIGQVRYQRKLPAVEQLVHKSELKLSLKFFRRYCTYKYAMCFEFLRGFRDGTFSFILNMILFEIVTSESLVGLNAFLTGIMAITGAWAYGKLVGPVLRSRYTFIATTIMLASCFLLLLKSSAPVVMLFAMVNAFFALFVSNASSNSAIDVMTQNALGRRCLGESLAIREIFLALGRIGGLLVLMLSPADMRGRIIAMLILTASQYLLALLIKLNFSILNRKRLCAKGAGA